MMSCFGCVGPSSIRPRKIYKLLVPDVFDGAPPLDLAAPISVSTQRRISKLQEYVQANPSKAGKVSRKLSRRIKKALYDHHYGTVRVAVAAYCQLLDKSRAEGSSYSFTYFNKELIHQPDALVSALLSSRLPEVQEMGARLLISYIDAQSDVEHQQHLCAEFIKRVLKLCQTAPPAAVTPNLLSASAAPPASLAGLTPTQSLHVECLEALQSYVKLCHRLKLLPDLLEQIEVVALDSLEPYIEATGRVPGGNRGSQDSLASSQASVAGTATTPATSSTHGDETGPGPAATDILRSFRPFVQDASSARRVVGALLSWLDVKGRWEHTTLVEALLGLVRDACGGVTYPLTSSLLRHAANEPALTPAQRATVARLAVNQGSEYSLSAFNLALLELPRMVLAGGGAASPGSPPNALQDAAKEVCVALSRQVGDAGQVGEALSNVLRAQVLTSSASPQLPGGGADVAHGADPGRRAALRHVTLECAVAVVEGLAAGKATTSTDGQGHAGRLPGNLLPAALVPSLTTALGPGGPTAVSIAPAALQLTAGLLQCVGPAPLKDDRQAVQLLELVAAAAGTMVTQGSEPALLPPHSVAACNSITASALRCLRPGVLLHGARLALQLAHQAALLLTHSLAPPAPVTVPDPAVAAGPDGAAPAPGKEPSDSDLAAAVLLAGLAQSCAALVAGPALCPALAAAQVPGVTLPPPGLVAQPNHTLTVAPGTVGWAVPRVAGAAAGPGGADLATGLETWRSACIQALTSDGILHREYGAALPALLDKPAYRSTPVAAHEVSGGGSSGAGTPVHASARSAGNLGVFRTASIRRDRLDVNRVLDVMVRPHPSALPVVPGSPTAAGVAATPAPNQAAPAEGHAGSPAPATLAGVLQLVDALTASGAAAGSAASKGGPAPGGQDVTLQALIAQLQPLASY